MNRPGKKATAEEKQAWVVYRSCTKKKVFSDSDAQQVIARKPWYRYYKCEYCAGYHLAKRKPSTKATDSQGTPPSK